MIRSNRRTEGTASWVIMHAHRRAFGWDGCQEGCQAGSGEQDGNRDVSPEEGKRTGRGGCQSRRISDGVNRFGIRQRIQWRLQFSWVESRRRETPSIRMFHHRVALLRWSILNRRVLQLDLLLPENWETGVKINGEACSFCTVLTEVSKHALDGRLAPRRSQMSFRDSLFS